MSNDRLMALHSQLEELINAMLPFVQEFHSKGQLAPHAASMSNAGEIKGSALVTPDDRGLSVPEALSHFQAKFHQAARDKEIIASAVFFHGVGLVEPSRPAETESEARAIVALLEHEVGESVFLVIPYQSTPSGIAYSIGKLVSKPAVVFTNPKRFPKPWWRIW